MPTKIPWTDETWNPISGCSPISAGCKNCYANRMSKRLAGRFGYPEAPHNFDVTFHADKLEQPLKWKKPRRIFVCSMGDLFHKDVDLDWLADVWHVMLKCKQHTFQILTKRPEQMAWWTGLFYGRFDVSCRNPPSNVWLGVTAENQKQADRRIPILLQIPAAVHFVSIEPMLGLVDIRPYLPYEIDSGGFDPQDFPISLEKRTGISWIILGAETGPGKRPMDLDWARAVRNQCVRAGIPFFFKKDSQGRHELDSCIWDQFPEAYGG